MLPLSAKKLTIRRFAGRGTLKAPAMPGTGLVTELAVDRFSGMGHGPAIGPAIASPPSSWRPAKAISIAPMRVPGEGLVDVTGAGV
jgi:hypothetical protein